MTTEASQKKQAVRETFARAAPYYDESPAFPFFGRRLVELADIPEGARVLDVATGRGAVLFPASERVGPQGRVIGIDLTQPMVEATAAEIGRRRVVNAEVRQMDAERLDFEPGSFDRVLCGFALWFIPDLHGALAEMRRVLKPGGTLAASTWGEQDPLTRRYNDLQRSYGVEIPNLASHSLNKLEALEVALREGGFAKVSTESEEKTFVFKDADEWWEQRNSGSQRYLDMLAPDRIERFKQDAFQLAKEFTGADGVHQVRSVVFAVAS